jgi:hypothetical protein
VSTTDRDSNVNGEREFKETMERRNAFSHYLSSLNKVFGILYLIDYYMKCDIVEQKCKIKVTGRSPLFPKTSRPKVQFDASTYESAVPHSFGI